MNFQAMESAKMPDAIENNDALVKTEDILEQGYAVEENIFEEIKKAVDDIIEILATVTEILEIMVLTDDVIEIVTVVEDDILETLPKAEEDISPFFKNKEVISDSLARSENETIEHFERMGNQVILKKDVSSKIENDGIFGKVLENGIAEETVNTLMPDNAVVLAEKARSSQEFIEDSNQIPVKEKVGQINISDLKSHYSKYRSNHINHISTLHDSRTFMLGCLEESSFIVQECRNVIKETDSTPDVNSMSEVELNILIRTMLGKVTVYKECLRSLCWSFDSINKKIHENKKLSNKIDMEREKFLKFRFPTWK